MTTEATVVIKGRNDLGYAIKSAERDLKRLAQTGELVGKFLRGGAIVGAIVAFERLAENAQKAAEQIGDKGTAKALGQLNKKIDELKAKGVNIIGQVLGGLWTAAFGSTGDKAALQLKAVQQRIDQIKASVGGNAGLLGPGLVQDLARLELEKKALQDVVDLYSKAVPYGERSRAPGGRNRQVTFDPNAKSGGSGKSPAEDALRELDVYGRQIFNLTNAQAQAIEEINQAAKDSNRRFFIDISNETNETLDEMTDRSRRYAEEMSDGMSVYAEQAARNIQSAFADFLFDPFEKGIKGMLAGFIDTIRRMVAEAAAAEILKGFFTWGASAFGGGVGSFFGSMASSIGTRASGGPVGAGKPYLVGEQGPELFVPGMSGAIIPNGAGGASVTINQSFDVRGADAERIMSVMPTLLKRAKDEAVAEIRDLKARGRL